LNDLPILAGGGAPGPLVGALPTEGGAAFGVGLLGEGLGGAADIDEDEGEVLKPLELGPAGDLFLDGNDGMPPGNIPPPPPPTFGPDPFSAAKFCNSLVDKN
jgi:hypothetical protein